jgi:hypothetical protein
MLAAREDDNDIHMLFGLLPLILFFSVNKTRSMGAQEALAQKNWKLSLPFSSVYLASQSKEHGRKKN